MEALATCPSLFLCHLRSSCRPLANTFRRLAHAPHPHPQPHPHPDAHPRGCSHIPSFPHSHILTCSQLIRISLNCTRKTMHVNCTQLDWQVRLGQDLPQDLDLDSDSGLSLGLPLLDWAWIRVWVWDRAGAGPPSVFTFCKRDTFWESIGRAHTPATASRESAWLRKTCSFPLGFQIKPTPRRLSVVSGCLKVLLA